MLNKKLVDNSKLKENAEISVYYLLGKLLCRKVDDKVIKKRITELEVYKQSDTACHAYKGKTKRNAPMFEEAGTIYVYLCYGIHYLLNIVTGQKDAAEGLMLRGLDNVFGSGKVGKMIDANLSLNYQNIFNSSDIWLEDDGYKVNKDTVIKLKRVGINYASQEDQDRLWRFRLPNF